MTLERADHQLDENHDVLWELFHENSKASRFERNATSVLRLTDSDVVRVMNRTRTVKPYDDAAKIPLPDDLPASTTSFDDIVLHRETARSFGGGEIGLGELGKILYFAYGLTRDNAGTDFPRPFRAVPSGGALYPLELYLYAGNVTELDRGLYHFDPEDLSLDVLRRADDSEHLASLMIQPELFERAAVTIFITALFGRSTFKYGDRGYRFALIEAGHVGQNVVLTANDLGLAAAPIGGFIDRDLDRYLRIDGVDESTVYTLEIGTVEREAPGTATRPLTALPDPE